MIAARLKLLLKIPPDIPLPAPGKVLSEISWVAGNRDFIEYIQVTEVLNPYLNLGSLGC